MKAYLSLVTKRNNRQNKRTLCIYVPESLSLKSRKQKSDPITWKAEVTDPEADFTCPLQKLTEEAERWEVTSRRGQEHSGGCSRKPIQSPVSTAWLLHLLRHTRSSDYWWPFPRPRRRPNKWRRTSTLWGVILWHPGNSMAKSTQMFGN